MLMHIWSIYHRLINSGSVPSWYLFLCSICTITPIIINVNTFRKFFQIFYAMYKTYDHYVERIVNHDLIYN